MLKKITKKYALADFYEDEFGSLVIASDDMDEIMKTAERYINEDVDGGECLLSILKWNSEVDGYVPMKTL